MNECNGSKTDKLCSHKGDNQKEMKFWHSHIKRMKVLQLLRDYSEVKDY